jgi:RNA polymerase sigma-70 factor (ECF subfamily)
MKQLDNLTDEQLVRQATLENDPDALGNLYNRYYKRVFQKCLSIVKDPDMAFDLAEEAILKAFDNLKGFKGQSSFSTWLYVITHRHCITSITRKNKQARALITMDKDRETHTTDSLAQEDQEAMMFSLINNLPEAERKLLLLKYSEGESIESLQEMFQLSASAIKMRLKRSKDKLNELYALASSAGLAAALATL